MNLSFFAKQPFFRENKEEKSSLYLQRVSSVIRAKEIAKFLDVKYNPKEGYEDDVCIYVKPPSLEMVKDGCFVDVLDDLKLTEAVKDRPGIKVIAMSFGIPTVAGPKLGYQDVDDYYIHAHNLDELTLEVEKLKDQKYYNGWVKKILPEAENYHISKIAKLYRALTNL